MPGQVERCTRSGGGMCPVMWRAVLGQVEGCAGSCGGLCRFGWRAVLGQSGGGLCWVRCRAVLGQVEGCAGSGVGLCPVRRRAVLGCPFVPAILFHQSLGFSEGDLPMGFFCLCLLPDLAKSVSLLISCQATISRDPLDCHRAMCSESLSSVSLSSCCQDDCQRWTIMSSA